MTTQADITCPRCDQTSTGSMPDDACVYFFECPHCHTVLRPLPGDCCVFCSYGDHECPPRMTQLGRSQDAK